MEAVIRVRKEHSINQIGGGTKVSPRKYTLLLTPYKTAGTRNRSEERKVADDTPWVEIGHFPPALITVARSFIKATVITIMV